DCAGVDRGGCGGGTGRKVCAGVRERTGRPCRPRVTTTVPGRAGARVQARRLLRPNGPAPEEGAGPGCRGGRVRMVSHQIIEEAAREVLETTAAVKVLGAAHRGQPDGSFTGLMATISLSGTCGGTLVIYCRREPAVRIAAG